MLRLGVHRVHLRPPCGRLPATRTDFAGWSPSDAISVSRHSLAEYVQLESNLTDNFDMSLAARHSNYSDFGSNTSYALSGRYQFSQAFAVRGTICPQCCDIEGERRPERRQTGAAYR